MVKLALKITFNIVAIFGWLGFILPWAISSRNDWLVAGGYVVTIFFAVLLVLDIVEDVVAIQIRRERR